MNTRSIFTCVLCLVSPSDAYRLEEDVTDTMAVGDTAQKEGTAMLEALAKAHIKTLDQPLAHGLRCNTSTSGTCGWFGCDSSRNATCHNRICTCNGGCSSPAGKCYVDQYEALHEAGRLAAATMRLTLAPNQNDLFENNTWTPYVGVSAGLTTFVRNTRTPANLAMSAAATTTPPSFDFHETNYVEHFPLGSPNTYYILGYINQSARIIQGSMPGLLFGSAATQLALAIWETPQVRPSRAAVGDVFGYRFIGNEHGSLGSGTTNVGNFSVTFTVTTAA